MGREAGYTTVLKLLQIMTEKGLVVRDEVGANPHLRRRVYPGSDAAAARDRSARPRVRRLGGQARAAGAGRRARRRPKSSPKSGSCSRTRPRRRIEPMTPFLADRRLDADSFRLAGRRDRRSPPRSRCGSPRDRSANVRYVDRLRRPGRDARRAGRRPRGCCRSTRRRRSADAAGQRPRDRHAAERDRAPTIERRPRCPASRTGGASRLQPAR